MIIGFYQMRDRPMTEQEKKEFMREQESRFVDLKIMNLTYLIMIFVKPFKI